MSHILNIDDQNVNFYNLEYNIHAPYIDFARLFQSMFKIDLPYYLKARLNLHSSIPNSMYYEAKNTLLNSNTLNTPYPIAVRYISPTNQFVVERPPFQLEVDFRLGSANSRNAKMPPVKIWIPWTVTILDLNTLTSGDFAKTRIYFNDGPLNSMDDKLIAPWLPNFYSSGAICFSSSMSDYASVLDNEAILAGNLSYIYNYIFNNYMTGGWNSDLSPSFGYLSCSYDPQSCLSLHKYFNAPKNDMKNLVASSLAQGDFSEETIKLIKRATNSNRQFNFYSHASVITYVKHFYTLSLFSLEETLSLITDLKKSSNTFNPHLKLTTLSSVLDGIQSDIYRNDSSNPVSSFYTNFVTKLGKLGHPDSSSLVKYSVIDYKIVFDLGTTLSYQSNYSFYSLSILTQKLKSKLDIALIEHQKNNPTLSEAIVYVQYSDDDNFSINFITDKTVGDLLSEHLSTFEDSYQNVYNDPSNSIAQKRLLLTTKERLDSFVNNTNMYV